MMMSMFVEDVEDFNVDENDDFMFVDEIDDFNVGDDDDVNVLSFSPTLKSA
jgi:hypothetical protein